MASTLTLPLKDIISPQFHQNNFAEESFVKNELGLKLDKGAQAAVPASQPLTNKRSRVQTTRYADCR